ncbi:MAG: hypothetical protein KatS3mg111_0730 [Pirellulaceae bacterium]|nr:MAG: hypothetical protein KatS3mg111_0730 [Pirellulaceae bacterium]
MSRTGTIASLLIKLDGTPGDRVAVELGVQWGQRFDARVHALAVVDEASYLIPFAEEPPSAFEQRLRRWEEAREAARRSLQECAAACAAAGLRCATFEESGNVEEVLQKFLQRHDLLVGGREAYHHAMEHANSSWASMLRDASRPFVLVPPSLPRGTTVIVAYNASRPAARMLSGLTASGLLADRRVLIVSVHQSVEQAAEECELAVDFLDVHGIQAEALAVQPVGALHEQLLEFVAAHDAGLIAAGAFGRSRPTEWVLGSHTRRLIRSSPVPIFLFH